MADAVGTDDTALESDLRVTIDRLQAEIRELHIALEVSQQGKIGWRGPVASLLIGLGSLMALVVRGLIELTGRPQGRKPAAPPRADG